ncbi:hypothetical protein NN561_014192 [Cricetulus griseus]
MVSAASAASTPRLVTGRPGWPPLHCAPTRPAPVASPLARPGEALPRRPRASLPRAPHRGGPGCGFPHLAARPQSSLPASPRAASPGRHHHIVDDQSPPLPPCQAPAARSPRACTSDPAGDCEGAEGGAKKRRGRGTGRSRDSAHGAAILDEGKDALGAPACGLVWVTVPVLDGGNFFPTSGTLSVSVSNSMFN